MKRVLLAATLALVLGLAALAGSAVAGDGHGGGGDHHGWGSGPGQQPSQPQQQPQQQPSQQQSSQPQHEQQSSQPQQQPSAQPQQQQSSQPQSGGHGWSSDHGSSDHGSSHASSSQSKQSSQPQQQSSGGEHGVKPSSTTSHWTHSKVGDHPDTSKRYGNGTTAADIAKSRGAPDDTVLTGPGNSQPHKVSDCAHKTNRSGGVDVHAVKSYDSTSCTKQPFHEQKSEQHVQKPEEQHAQKPEEQKPEEQKQVEQTPQPAPCGTTTVTEQVIVGMAHFDGKGRFVKVMTNPHSAHFTKREHDDQPVFATVTKTVPVTNCAQTPSSQSVVVQQPSVQTVTPAPASAPAPAPAAPAAGVLPAAATVTPAPAPVAAPAPAAAAPGSGGVLGAQATLSSPKAKPSSGGVLGTTGRVAGTSLPFTGLPLWIAVLIAAGLVGGGVALRHRPRAGSDRL